MPRITDSNSGPVDFCRRCFPRNEQLAAAEYRFQVPDHANDGRGCCFEYECDHPWYEDWYTCAKCGKPLTEEDN